MLRIVTGILAWALALASWLLVAAVGYYAVTPVLRDMRLWLSENVYGYFSWSPNLRGLRFWRRDGRRWTLRD
ncbi:hypothetical protein CTA1_8801 [Colletotrichum tanaceti]|uniref:Uncharacterized protein n=1 Tax=Colletotrichum tanaceti TaxID=1306861 RepID=A0A4U6XF01_9PEZI|nr:hypothetical protein CTA1_8801 [Colletotrichum tanaceti]